MFNPIGNNAGKKGISPNQIRYRFRIYLALSSCLVLSKTQHLTLLDYKIACDAPERDFLLPIFLKIERKKKVKRDSSNDNNIPAVCQPALLTLYLTLQRDK